MTQDSFFDGICEFTGIIDGRDISGTFRCNNDSFDEGNWFAIEIQRTGDTTFQARLGLDLTNRPCSYEAEYIGLR